MGVVDPEGRASGDGLRSRLPRRRYCLTTESLATPWEDAAHCDDAQITSSFQVWAYPFGARPAFHALPVKENGIPREQFSLRRAGGARPPW
jgi:hypothetical protein